jgi:signal transduction histidine kinase/ActR/RegA family two-component response regulator
VQDSKDNEQDRWRYGRATGLRWGVVPQGLATKLSLAITLVVIVSLGALSLLAVSISRATLRDQALAANLTLATLAARAVEQHLIGAISIMREAPGRPKLGQEVRSNNWPEATKVLENFLRHFPQFDYVFVQDTQGVIRARVPHADSVGQDFSFREFFQAVMRTRTLYTSDVYESKAAQRPVVAIAAPVLEGPDRVAGVLVGALSLQTMTDVVSAIAKDDGAQLYIVDRKGALIARSSGTEPGLRGDLAALSIVQAAVASKAGTMEFPAADGREILLGAHAPISRLGWGVVGIKPASIALAPADRLRRWLFGTTVGCAALAVVLGWRLAHALTGPLARLATATRRLAEGDFDVRVTPEGRDEVAALAASFNRMVGQVHASYQGLERTTKEVEAINEDLTREVAERKRAEGALAKHSERLRMLHEIDRALIAEKDPAAIAEAAVRPLRELLGVSRAIVNVFDLATGEVEWLAAAGRRRVHLAPGVRYSLEFAGDIEALRRGEPQVIDVHALAPSHESEALLASGVHIYMVVPMIAGGELIGSVSIGGETGPFRPEQVSIAQEAATQLAIAIAQARLHERVKRQAEELEERVEERTLELSAANQRLEEEIGERRRAEAEADRANRAKSEFLSRMSHELRTPLNGILGFGQLLEMEALAPEPKESVEQILRAGRHLLAVINEVLEISQIEAGRIQLSLEPVPVYETVRQAVGLVQPSAGKSRIAVRADAVDERLHALADRQRLQQVLLNLLANAVKYNRPGGVVAVSCEAASDNRLRIHVADTGQGIAAEKLARLFTPFDRLGVEASGVEGTGLGLALSKHLVTAMGGTMLVRSQVDVGSIFSVELPIAAAPAAVGDAASEIVPGLASDAGRLRLKILYIEDNLSNLRLVERILVQRPGVTLLSAMQGRRGLELARDHRPGLILLDRHLPDVPGDEVLRLLREDPRTQDIPVVILSADASRGQVQRLLDIGARAYLTKPLDVRRFLAVVDESAHRDGE